MQVERRIGTLCFEEFHEGLVLSLPRNDLSICLLQVAFIHGEARVRGKHLPKVGTLHSFVGTFDASTATICCVATARSWSIVSTSCKMQ